MRHVENKHKNIRRHNNHNVVCCCTLNKTLLCDEHLYDKLAQTQVVINWWAATAPSVCALHLLKSATLHKYSQLEYLIWLHFSVTQIILWTFIRSSNLPMFVHLICLTLSDLFRCSYMSPNSQMKVIIFYENMLTKIVFARLMKWQYHQRTKTP